MTLTKVTLPGSAHLLAPKNSSYSYSMMENSTECENYTNIVKTPSNRWFQQLKRCWQEIGFVSHPNKTGTRSLDQRWPAGIWQVPWTKDRGFRIQDLRIQMNGGNWQDQQVLRSRTMEGESRHLLQADEPTQQQVEIFHQTTDQWLLNSGLVDKSIS